MKSIVLYNPYSANGQGEKLAHALDDLIGSQKLIYMSMPDIDDFKKFFKENKEDIIICGGDGTLHYFINKTDGINYKNDILYYATGSGNDFLKDIGQERGKYPFSIKKYITNLPYAIVNNQEYRFLNNIGFGMDGYCCREADRLKKISKKSVNYTKIALKGLLYGYKPVNATITVDEKTYHFKNVMLAPTMHGKYYGGGMMCAPMQERNNNERTVSLVVMHIKNKAKAIVVFPSIFKGDHIKYTDMVTVLIGKKINVKFDKMSDVQIDGDTIPDVLEYTVCTDIKEKLNI